MAESYPMTGGEGEHSYYNNSETQRKAADIAKDTFVSAVIEHLHIQDSATRFCIADLGCSVGPNTFIAVDTIIQAVTKKYQPGLDLPDFHVFFNDHVSNDFNVLFSNLPPNRNYFAVGVPGSFHTRLFPRGFLNFAYSAYALQWLSRLPPELDDLNSPKFNRGRIFYDKAGNEVGDAYSAQYSKDMKLFLSARAEELVPGGLMALLIPGRPDGTLPSQSSLGPIFSLLESCLLDMVNEGIVSSDKVDAFNLPLYSPSMEELLKLVKENGYFEIARLEHISYPNPNMVVTVPSAEVCRAGLTNLLTKYFGGEKVDELFVRYNKRAKEYPPITELGSVGCSVFVLLKRK